MLKTSRLHPFPKAYTIIESLVVLAILAVLTVVLFALLKHEKAPAKTTDKASTSLSESADNEPSEPLPTVEDETE